MRKFSYLFAVVCLISSWRAAATDWDSVAGWDVYEIDRTRCVVGRTFSEAGGTIFGIILHVNGETRLFASSSGWTTRAGQKVAAEVGLDDRVHIDEGFVGVAERDRNGFVAAAPAAFLTEFASATTMTLKAAGNGPVRSLSLTGSAAGLAQGRQCVANLRAEARDLQPQAQPVMTNARLEPQRFARRPSAQVVRAAVARPAVPRKSKASWVAADDYPDAALRAEQQGLVTVKLAINRTGAVAGCNVVRSSGSEALDGTTCRIIQRRARYRPATDAVGRPIDSFDQHTVRWSLPD